MRRLLSPFIGVLLIVVLASSAAAQGKGGGNGNGNGRPKEPKNNSPAPAPSPAPDPTPSSSSGGSSSAPASAASDTGASAAADVPTPATSTASMSFRQFGAWLDDASAPIRGEGYTSIGIGHWRMLGVSQTNAPMLGVGVGMTDRVLVSASVPFYRVAYDGGDSSGLDDVYLSAKYSIVDPTLTVSEFGLAVSPVLEVLSADAGDGRIHFAIPVSAEIRRYPVRVYGSAGYFSRGAFFSGGALEWVAPNNLVLTGSLTQSYSLPESELLDSLAVSRQRADVSFSVAYPLGTRAVTYGAIGRSLTSIDEGGTRLALSGGISFRFNVNRATP